MLIIYSIRPNLFVRFEKSNFLREHIYCLVCLIKIYKFTKLLLNKFISFFFKELFLMRHDMIQNYSNYPLISIIMIKFYIDMQNKKEKIISIEKSYFIKFFRALHGLSTCLFGL